MCLEQDPYYEWAGLWIDGWMDKDKILSEMISCLVLFDHQHRSTVIITKSPSLHRIFYPALFTFTVHIHNPLTCIPITITISIQTSPTRCLLNSQTQLNHARIIIAKIIIIILLLLYILVIMHHTMP